MSIHTQLILKILFERHVEKSNFDRRKRVSISDFCDEWQRRVCIIHQSLVKTRAFRHVCAWEVGKIEKCITISRRY